MRSRPSPRRGRPQWAAVLFLSSAACGLLAGCSSNAWKKEVISANAGVVIYREHLENESGQVALGYKHPFDAPRGKMLYLLSQLGFEERYFLGLKSPKNRFVFYPDQASALVEPLCRALATAKPDERIRFLVTESNWSNAFLGAEGTSGVAFSRQAGILEIALDRIQEKLSSDQVGDPATVVFRIDPTTYEGADPLVLPAGTTVQVDPETKEMFPRWFRVDFAMIVPPAAPTAVAAPGLPGSGAQPPATPPTAATAPAAGATPPATTPAAQPGTAASAEAEARYRSLRDQLETLKRLRTDGVLTEEQYTKAYEKVMAEMLDGTPQKR